MTKYVRPFFSEEKSPVFLLGAGASKPAGLYGIGELTETFENEKLDNEHRDVYNYIKKVLKAKYETVDIEHILQQLTEFNIGQRETSYLFYGQPDKQLSRHQDKFVSLINLIKKYLREKLEVEFNIDYLIGLRGFVERYGIVDIFSLNYDSVIETYCEKEGIAYTDGFELKWNPKNFENVEKGIRLYKLHGSLYWFKTERNKLVKIPMKHCNPEDMTYYSDEKLAETMIYPTVVKELESNPFSFLFNTFKSKLLTTNSLIVVGYSFRDESILNPIKEQLRVNTNLWLIIVDLKPEYVKKKICGNDTNLNDRTVILPLDSEKAFGTRILNNNIELIERTVDDERRLRSEISKSPQYSPTFQLQSIVYSYKTFNHFSRIKSLIEEVASIEFKDFTGFSHSLKLLLFDNSLKFGLECFEQKDWKNAELWFQIFGSLGVGFENSLFRDLNENKVYSSYWGEKSRPYNLLRERPSNSFGSVKFSSEVVNSIENGVKEIIFAIVDSLKALEEMDNAESKSERATETFDRSFNLTDFQKKVDAFIHKYNKREIGLCFYVPQLLNTVSSKINRDDSITKNWIDMVQ